MNNWYEKKRLADQLKFFNHKPKRFISCYSNKKPRIRLSVKTKAYHSGCDVAQQRLSALYRDQLNRGMQNSAFGYSQLAAANMAAQGQAQFGGSLGLQGGLGIGLFGGQFI